MDKQNRILNPGVKRGGSITCSLGQLRSPEQRRAQQADGWQVSIAGLSSCIRPRTRYSHA